MKGFDFEEEKLSQEIPRRGAKSVLLQFPEGLKPEGPRLAELVSKAGAVPIISADPCYGGCDLARSEAESLGVDLIVHFGHAEFLKQAGIPTLYVEARAKASVDEVIQRSLLLLKDYNKVGLATTVQHLQELNHISEMLSEAGKTVLIGNLREMPYAGQVTGCNYSNVTSIANEVEAFLFVGGGVFHALGVALSTSKPTFIADPFDNRAFRIFDEAQKILKQRWTCIQEAREAKTFGVFVGLKPGQRRLDQALYAKAIAEKHGKMAYLLAAREVTPDTIMEFPSIDVYVNTACPRISLENAGKFSKPVLTQSEFMVAIGEGSWESLLKKGLFAN